MAARSSTPGIVVHTDGEAKTDYGFALLLLENILQSVRSLEPKADAIDEEVKQSE